MAAEGEQVEDSTLGQAKCRDKLAWENGVLRMKLTALSLQVNHFKEVFRKENTHLREQLQHLENSLVKSVEMLRILVKKEQSQGLKGRGQGMQGGNQASVDRRGELPEMLGELSPQSVVWGERPPLAVGKYQKKFSESNSKVGERSHLRSSNFKERYEAPMGYELRENFGTPIKRQSSRMERVDGGRTVGREHRPELSTYHVDRQWAEENSRANMLHDRRWDHWEKENRGVNMERRERRVEYGPAKGAYGYERMDRYY